MHKAQKVKMFLNYKDAEMKRKTAGMSGKICGMMLYDVDVFNVFAVVGFGIFQFMCLMVLCFSHSAGVQADAKRLKSKPPTGMAFA